MKALGPLLACSAFAACIGCGSGGGAGGGEEAPTDTSPALAALAVSHGSLSPSFSPDVGAYVVGPSSTLPDFVSVTPTVAHAGETVTVDGLPVASGTAFSALHLGGGTNVFLVAVQAQNGLKRTYMVWSVAGPLPANDRQFHRMEIKVTAAGEATFSYDGTIESWTHYFPSASLAFSLSHTSPGGGPADSCRLDDVLLKSP